MLRKLLIIACLLHTITGMAQQPASVPAAKPQPPDYKAIGMPLPAFTVVPVHEVPGFKDSTVEGAPISNADVTYDGRMVLMLFSPTCSHCQHAAEEIERHMTLLKDEKVLMVSSKPMKTYLGKFAHSEHTGSFDNIVVGYDNGDLVNKLFKYQMLPQISIYDRERKLTCTFTGGNAVDSLVHRLTMENIEEKQPR